MKTALLGVQRPYKSILELFILLYMFLKDKTALVTGSVHRIGKSIALTLAEQGANVLIHGRKQGDEADKLIGIIRKAGRQAAFVPYDLRDSDGAGPWFEQLCRQYGGMDILVNSACEYRKDSYENLSSSDLNEAMAVQVLSPLAMMRVMKQSGCPGTVVNILDTRYCDRDGAHASYHLAKRGLHTLTRDLAMEYAPLLRVNAVAPGIILKPLNGGGAWLDRMAGTNPLDAYGTPRDVSDAVLYLVRAAFVTGQIIFVDGGRHLKGCAYGS
ncbi:MAG: hypothetical protein B6D68_02560 [spirochete symbiont of Stewartia floridana]|nr:MAG: hypothetical protein B6D68_02560 [spirochete symbiont of Stewartia floridana]